MPRKIPASRTPVAKDLPTMNKYQRLVITVAAINVLLMVLFPPFNSQPLAKGMLPNFDGFYPLLTHIGSKQLYKELLTLQLMFVGANTLTAWLVLQNKTHHDDIPQFAFMQGIAGFLAVNLAIIFTFPPFEPYQSLLRVTGSTFDSFYFIFGDRSQRPIYTPLLYLECVFIVANALAFLLLFNAVKRGDEETRRKIMRLTEALPDQTLLEIRAAIGNRIEAHHAQDKPPQPAIGRTTERRHRTDPHYHGPERRKGNNRRA
jgi:hypothetical protein